MSFFIINNFNIKEKAFYYILILYYLNNIKK